MKKYTNNIDKYNLHIQYALDNYYDHKFDIKSIDKIIILGGNYTKILASIISQYFLDKISIPIIIISDCKLPRYVNNNSLIILLDYNSQKIIKYSYDNIINRKLKKVIIISHKNTFSNINNEFVLYFIPDSHLENDIFTGCFITYLYQIIFELLKVYCKHEIESIKKYLSNIDNYYIESKEIYDSMYNLIDSKYVVITDDIFLHVGNFFCCKINNFSYERRAFNTNILESISEYKNIIYHTMNTNYIILNSRFNIYYNEIFGNIKKNIKQTNNKIINIIIKNNTLYDIYHTLYKLDWVSEHIINNK
ncbi:MAG: hypothetical protein IR527_02645 [Bacteroides sp.]|nr:MAG: hypothetical protein IR527_02645 [Bacteroides sp.]